MAKHNAKRRSKGTGRFAQLHHFMLNSAAWRALKPAERAVYIEVLAIYDGKNNGRIALGVRDAADRCNINKDTASKCFKRLEELGFIELAQPGGFSLKLRHAAEWRLTQFQCDRTGAFASKGFMSWRPEDSELGPSKSDNLSPRTGRCAGSRDLTVPRFRTVEAA